LITPGLYLPIKTVLALPDICYEWPQKYFGDSSWQTKTHKPGSRDNRKSTQTNDFRPPTLNHKNRLFAASKTLAEWSLSYAMAMGSTHELNIENDSGPGCKKSRTMLQHVLPHKLLDASTPT
jgi:hypothetical protein